MIHLLVFLSGFCALVYQVLWMKQLALLFGNTSHAAGATLAAFFLGLAAGSGFWGRRSAGSRNPLRVYAGLELGIALTALLYFAVLHGYQLLYPLLYQSVHSGVWLLLIKFLLALILIFPPAFCMGGTIPVMGQHAIRVPTRFGSTAALLYGINTLGATLGAFLAGFFLPLWFGFRLTCVLAIAITVVVALVAWWLSFRAAAAVSQPRGQEKDAGNEAEAGDGAPGEAPSHRKLLTLICFFSGLGVLALEVLWTRMFALVLENSVYTYAAILVVVLSCLAGGALLSSLLARRNWPPAVVLASLLGLSGWAVALTPTVFMQLTDSFQFQSERMLWADFVLLIFRKCALTIGPPALILGAVFPYLMKREERNAGSPGRRLGRLAMINTVGAILGSIVCAFVLLEQIGLWRSMQVIGVLYFLMALAMPLGRGRGTWVAIKGLAVLGLGLILTLLSPGQLPATGVLSSREDEEVLKTWEGSDCTVSVVRGQQGLAIKINSDYGLGTTDNWQRQEAQAVIPMMLKPDVRSVFFLGMGTGISAGGALSERFPLLERVVTCELSPDVIAAAKEFMTDVDGVDLTQGLFRDSRSTVLAEDGRHYLMATGERFDLINADLFVPYRASTGSLYTREHFQSVKERLKPGGLFVQWLPAYQVTEFEFKVIGRTMLEVFDAVSLWRCDFAPFNEVVAFVGHEGGQPLPACDLDDRAARMGFLEGEARGDLYRAINPQSALIYYCGNLKAAEDWFDEAPINTDDRPIIQYQAPRQYRERGEKETPWFVGPRLLSFIQRLQEEWPPGADPLLVRRSPANQRLPLAGSAYHGMSLWARFDNAQQVQRNWQLFLEGWLPR